MSRVNLDYMEDATGMARRDKVPLKDEQEEVRQSVINTLESPGYNELHKIFLEFIGNATAMLLSKNTSQEDIRYYQGVIHGIDSAQKEFRKLSTEEGYVR